MSDFNDFFIGREKELATLESIYKKSGRKFLILYGRHRMGKTELLKKALREAQPVYFKATQTDNQRQLDNFYKAISPFFAKDVEFPRAFYDWKTAFSKIKELHFEKKVLVIDNCSYLTRDNNEVLDSLKEFWESDLKGLDILVILCTSSISYVEKEILADDNILNKLKTSVLKVSDMPYYDSEKFISNFNPLDKIVLTLLTGGVPYYLSQFDDDYTLEDNIVGLLLNKDSILYDETEFLIHQYFREPATYNSIIQAIASGYEKFHDIQETTAIEKGKLSVYLKNLMDNGIVEREFSVLGSKASKQGIHKGRYRVKDLFFRFYYAYVIPNSSILDFFNIRTFYRNEMVPSLYKFLDAPFCDMCIEWLNVQNDERYLPFIFTKIGHWWDKDNNIDILACDNKREKFVCADCAFRETEVTREDIEKLVNKNLKLIETENAIQKKFKVFYFYFAWNGFSDEALDACREFNVKPVSGVDIYTK